MKSRAVLLLLSAAWLPCSARDAGAVRYKLNPPVNDYYIVEAEYDEKQAYAGKQNLELTVTLTPEPGGAVPAGERLELTAIQSVDEGRIGVSEYAVTGGGRVHVFHVDIPEGLEPRIYPLTFECRSPRQGKILRQVNLNVWERNGGKLRFVEAESDPLILGSVSEHRLNFVNDYADYPVNINRITVRSSPPGLIEGIEVVLGGEARASVSRNVITFDPSVTIDPAKPKPVDLLLRMKSMPGPLNWVTGIGEATKLLLDVEYNDSFGRPLSARAEAKVKVRPGDRLLLVTMIVGVLVGTFIKFYLEYLRKTGVITKKGVAEFVVVTVLVGVVITIIAWAGEIQIIAFKEIKLSYDKPSVIFVIGLVGALSGVHYLHNWSRKLTAGGGERK